MKNTLIKLLSFFAAGIITVTPCIETKNSLEASASTNVLLGDANNDGNVNMSDSVYIMQYLYGSKAPTAKCVTAMDVNEDCVIDMTDAYIIQYMEAYSINPTIKNKNLYSVPSNTGRCYYKHRCTSLSASSYTSYTLSSASTTFINNDTENIYRNVLSEPDQNDEENINVVELTYGDNDDFLGSGFIINNHLVATAAHCVYDKGSSEFISNIKVKIFDSDGIATNNNGVVIDDHLLFTAHAKYIHIPELYVTTPFPNEDNYDYALIYVYEDLLQQNITGLNVWQMGVATKEFMNTNSLATTSGFRWNGQILGRYYSEGNVIPILSTDHNDANLRISTSGNSHGGKSGGVVYYESSYNSLDNFSAIAIVTGSSNSPYDGDTWATKINPTLLRFFFQNPNV